MAMFSRGPLGRAGATRQLVALFVPALALGVVYFDFMSNDNRARHLIAANDVAAIAALLDENARLQARLSSDVSYLQNELKADRGLRSLSGDSAAMEAMRP